MAAMHTITRRLGEWAPLPLRLIVGYGFLVHGYAKLMRGPDSFAAVLHTLGALRPHLLAWLTTLVEPIGGAGPLSVDAQRSRR
jgi:putative oxidoreductase